MPKRRQITPEFKARVVLEVISGTRSGAEVCREYNLQLNGEAQWPLVEAERAEAQRRAGGARRASLPDIHAAR